jgi:hypothetical protein
MQIIGPSLLQTLILVSLAVVTACFIAAVGGFIRYTTRAPGASVRVYWLTRMGIFVGVPFSIVGIVSGYMTGSARVSAISNLVPAAITLIGAVVAYLFTKGGKSAVMSAFAVINFSILILVGVLIGGYERQQSEQIENSLEYKENELLKEFTLERQRRALQMEILQPKKQPNQAD